jgi:GDPmannose 4,6-dehydratase
MTVALITGITGQDGGYLAEQLLAEGVAVHGLVHEHDLGRADLLSRCPTVTLHSGDLTDEPSLARILTACEPDEVYNLAGISSVAFSWQHPVATADVTALGAARLLEHVWQLQERLGRQVRFVQATSAEIFGDAAVAPQDESTPVRPSTPYGASKAFAHHLVGVYRGRDVHAVSAILYNHESPRRPPSFVSRKISRAAARISGGLEHELVLGNLEARRDWGWAPDYVNAMVLAARHTRAADYVIASGSAHSIREFAAAAFARANVPDWKTLVRVDPSLVRPAEAAVQVGDATLASTQLGWSPTVDFLGIVHRMVDADLALLL